MDNCEKTKFKAYLTYELNIENMKIRYVSISIYLVTVITNNWNCNKNSD